MSEDDEGNGWHNRQSLIMAAGAAAVLLLGLLVFAVIQMSGGSTKAPEPVGPLPTFAPTSGSRTSSSTSTSYTVPSFQTSELSPVPAPPAVEQPPEQPPEPDVTTPSTPTTIFNPYVTTTQPAAGHV